jgi:phosphatidylinositol-3-phosphatase
MPMKTFNSLNIFLAVFLLLIAIAATGCGGGGSSSPGSNNGPQGTSVTVTPSTTAVVVGKTQQFQAAGSNTSNSSVNWQVNGVAGGNAGTGTIDANGLYTAPVNVPAASSPAAAAVTIKAVSKTDASQSGSATATIQLPQSQHVFLLLEENHSLASVTTQPSPMPFLLGLANAHGLAMNYFADTHPSIGNYFMLTTGQVITNDDLFTQTVDTDNLVRELLAAGKTWKSYAENLPSVGYIGPDAPPYLAHHNPFAFFSDVRNSPTQLLNLVPFTQFSTDLANNQLPTVSFILPNAAHDAHDCPGPIPNCTDAQKLQAADAWLNTNLQPLLASSHFQAGGDGVLIIVFDESDSADTVNGGGHVFMTVISPLAKGPFSSQTLYKHESLLRMLVELTGAKAYPGASANAPDMGEFF